MRVTGVRVVCVCVCAFIGLIRDAQDIKPLPARSLFGGLFSRDGALVMVEATAYLKSEECAEPVKAIRVPELFGEPSLYSQGVQVCCHSAELHTDTNTLLSPSAACRVAQRLSLP
jgi:hypothetical protein